jgi:hypothetical protein
MALRIAPNIVAESSYTRKLELADRLSESMTALLRKLAKEVEETTAD